MWSIIHKRDFGDASGKLPQLDAVELINVDDHKLLWQRRRSGVLADESL